MYIIYTVSVYIWKWRGRGKTQGKWLSGLDACFLFGVSSTWFLPPVFLFHFGSSGFFFFFLIEGRGGMEGCIWACLGVIEVVLVKWVKLPTSFLPADFSCAAMKSFPPWRWHTNSCQIIKRWANHVMLAFREQSEVFHVYCCRLWNTNTHLISYFSSSSACGPKGSENVSLWQNSGCKTFYLVDYEANSSESPRHKCITMNHNIPCHPASPRKMTAWHHHFPSKNTAFKKVKEGMSFTQHRPLTWSPFTELGDLE